MTAPKSGGYTHRRLVQNAQRLSGEAVRNLRKALESETPRAQAAYLCACSVSLAEVAQTLSEMRALIDDVGEG